MYEYDIDGREDREEGDEMRGKVLEGFHVTNVHEAKLDRPIGEESKAIASSN